MQIFGTIEDAVLTALEPLKNDGSIKTLAVYSGELDFLPIEETTFSFPCCYVICNGVTVTGTKNTLDEVNADIELRIATWTVNAKRTQDQIDSGLSKVRRLYTTIENIRYYLNRLKIADGWSFFKFLSVNLIGYDTNSGICLYSMKYSMKGMVQQPTLIT